MNANRRVEIRQAIAIMRSSFALAEKALSLILAASVEETRAASPSANLAQSAASLDASRRADLLRSASTAASAAVSGLSETVGFLEATLEKE